MVHLEIAPVVTERDPQGIIDHKSLPINVQQNSSSFTFVVSFFTGFLQLILIDCSDESFAISSPLGRASMNKAFSRLSFISCWVCGLLFGSQTCDAADQSESNPKRPNLIFILTDDQRWDALGVVQREQGEKARFPWLESPNLDRLAREGARFRNAFVVNSLCSPSRASFLTGAYGHKNGVRNNGTPFPVTNVTFATQLQSAGYRTAYIGKWHQGQQKGQRPGFDYSASFIGQGRYFDCPMEINGVLKPTSGWVDDVSTDFALDFLNQSKDAPFLLVVGYKTCHGPFTPPERTQKSYVNEGANQVPNLNSRAIYRLADEPVAKKKAVQTKAALKDGQVPTNMGMFRGLRAIDENVGRILERLDHLKLTDDTLIVYSSDNGYYLGEHGLGDKRSAYEESLRIPMIVKYPNKISADIQLDQMILNIDLAPTLLDFAGVDIPMSMQGRSWKPLLEGRDVQDWRKAFFYCYYREPQFNTPMVTALRTETEKLIVYPGHESWTELFDLQSDPYEIQNLAELQSAKAIRARLLEAYQKEADRIGFPKPIVDNAPARVNPAPKKKQAVRKDGE